MRYLEIAQRIAGDILASKKPGERLPGLRELAKKEHISLITARNVYLHLAGQGLITSKQGSGTYVAYGRHKGPIDMSSIRPPEEHLLWALRHLKADPAGLSAYDPPEGLEPLIHHVSKWLKRTGIETDPIITAGSQQALFLTGLALLKPGDEVAVEDPGYTGALRIFESLGASIRHIPYIKSPEDINALTRERIRLFYTMPQCHIPTGLHIPSQARTRLLETALKNDFYILEDDPLSELGDILPLKASDTGDRVIYIKSLSNILGPGLRIGFTAIPQPLYSSILNLKEINDLSLSGILQRILLGMISSGDLARHITRLKTELCNRRSYISENFGSYTDGPCLWLDMNSPGRIHSERLFRKGIRVTPGDIYGARWANHIRISIMTPSGRDFNKAMQIIKTYMEKHSRPGLTDLF